MSSKNEFEGHVNLTETEKDTLAEIGNISMGSAATALSSLINQKVTITVPDVSVSSFVDVRQSYPIPCIIVNVEYENGLQGYNLLVIKEEDAAVIGNLMMGSDPDAQTIHEINEMSISALSEAMNVMMGSAATAMSELFSYKISISPPTAKQHDLQEETDLVEDGKPVTVISFHFEIPGLVDSTMLQVIDIDFAKKIVSQLLNSDQPEEEQIDDSEPAETIITGTSWNDLKQDESYEIDLEDEQELGNLNVELIKNIPVQVRAVLGKTKMSIENILQLGPGHIMELDSLDGEPIDVYANETLIARGEVVVVGEQFGIRITEISTPKNRIKSIGH